ncbi:MAG: L-threonylcarbamoyladenylate synthase [Fimbriimonadales bacterium]
MKWVRESAVEEVAAAIKVGAIAIVPTETVYGIASTLDDDALAKVFRAKGRPEGKPLIVGVSGAEMAGTVCAEWPAEAQALAERFWPGPLSLVLPKAEGIPLTVTAGGSTVAVRAPGLPITMRLIELVGEPIVLTSANVSSNVSPLTAAEAVAQIGLSVAYVLDSGRSPIGIESTVYEVSTRTVLRHGAIPEEGLKAHT